MIAYQGPSEIDGQPVVCILTGVGTPSRNRKTGPMVQSMIIRSDVSPLEAVSSGSDVSVCGGCPHRARDTPGTGGHGRRACYVDLTAAPSWAYSHYRAGHYGGLNLERLRASGRALRLGTYGDPAAVPFPVWRLLLEWTAGHTGYTHQWRRLGRRSPFRRILLASVDSAAERLEARAAGWGTLRVLGPGQQLEGWEQVCPATAEGGSLRTCAECLQCDGRHEGGDAKPLGIAVRVHGSGARHFGLDRVSRQLPLFPQEATR